MSIIINYSTAQDSEPSIVLDETDNGDAQDLQNETDLNLASVGWDTTESFDTLKTKVDVALNGSGDTFEGYGYWVRDIQPGKALVCAGGEDYYVVNFSLDKDGNVSLAEEKKWTAVAQEWVKQNKTYLSEDNVAAEIYLTDSKVEDRGDGLLYKTVARVGSWKFSPGAGQRPVSKPLTFVKDGASDSSNLIVSLEELKQNFDNGVVDHVTIPLSHADKVEENTGFIRTLQIEEKDGVTELVAGIDFTEPDIKDKVLRGTIANISSGINFDYIKKDVGKKFNAVLGHAALTNKPWLNGMPAFKTSLGEASEILAFSEQENFNSTDVVIEEENNLVPQEGGSKVETEQKEETAEVTFLSELGLSEDVAKSMLTEYKALKDEQKANNVKEQARTWQSENKTPAMIKVAESILLADEGVSVLNLSEEGKDVSLTATDIVNRLMEAAPEVKLSEAPLTDEEVKGEKPASTTDEENDKAELSLAERSEVTQLMFEKNMKEADAIKEVTSKNESK